MKSSTLKPERRLQERARRRATRQLLKVNPKLFREAQQQYLKWESFSLWVRAIFDAEGFSPRWLLEVIQKRCPDFQQEKQKRKTQERKSGFLPLHLLEWIHNKIFSAAKSEGWLDALMFFSVRDPRSQRTWAYWEHCEAEWKKKRPRSHPTFKQWVRAVEKWKQ